ncbi:GEgh16 protein [Colletotrichum nymphaeae SA-01]|uniref:GEgh16 protein n=1 Tax=Colletotrichum nymphaeae SA-01 TaxID=1460502 RepID=A0A135TH28_9PEZI|nr:GEgh16 protein [Colletotrichum nymphaeae SA-01]
MSSPMMRALAAAAMLAMAQAQGVILAAQGPNGPASPGLLVDANKADANIINQKEIVDNVVNECGRTILAGNIDIGETTEAQLGNNTVTKVTKGSNVDVTIAQVSPDGAGPYSCDLDLTSNANGATGQTKLQVQEAGAQSGQIKLKVTMPDDLACVGASTGDVCTVRCFNDNAKGPFGGCFAVQQTDTKPKQNTPANIPTAQTLDGVLKQVQQNIVDLPAAVKSNQEAKTQDDQGNGGNNGNANANANGNSNALPLATVGKGNGNRQNQQNGNNNKRDETPDAVLRTRWARRNLRRRAD